MMGKNQGKQVKALLLALMLAVTMAFAPAQTAQAVTMPTINVVSGFNIDGVSLYQGQIAAFQFEATRGSYEVENAAMFIYPLNAGENPEPVGYAGLTIQDRNNVYGEGTEERFAGKSLIHWIVDWDTSEIAPGDYVAVAYIGAWNGDFNTTTDGVHTPEIYARVSIKADDRPAAIPMYRLYYPGNHEHFYTADAYEKHVLTTERGWNDEGIGWTAPRSSNEPVYRLFNPYDGEHHYTRDKNERNTLVETGWTYEGVGWYSDTNQAVPVYRQFAPSLPTGRHNYTTDAYERAVNAAGGAWIDEGIGWYGLK